MNLVTHIKRSGLNVCDYAERVGVSHMTLYNAINDKFSWQTAQKIFDYSEGKVELIIKPKKKD